METNKKQFADVENNYICLDCGKITAELDLQGKKDIDGYYILTCDCGSTNIKNNAI